MAIAYPRQLVLTFILLTASGVGVRAAGPIRCEGILGNSGADGEMVVQVNTDNVSNRSADFGLGFDRLGRLWAFGGRDRLNAYALDGRMMATFPLPGKKTERRSFAVAGDWVVLRSGENLSRLPITATTGQSFEVLKPAVRALSTNAAEDGSVGFIGVDGSVTLFKPADSSVRPVGPVPPEARADHLILMPDGSLLVDGAWRMRAGQTPEKLASAIGGSAQLAGDHVYTLAAHMTLGRLNLSLRPDPGVVYGGSSGSVIGTLPRDGELELPRGIAWLGGDRFAVVGVYGIVHIIAYSTERKNFEPVRRLGSVHFPAALALDNAGRTWFFSGYWEWSDGPEHTLRNAISGDRDYPNAQAGILPGGQVVYPVVTKGVPSLFSRAFEESAKRVTAEVPQMPTDPTGLAIFAADKANTEVVIVDSKGMGIRLQMDGQGRFRKVIGPCALTLSSSSPDVTSLATTSGGDECLAADGGSIVRLRRDADNFREVNRVNQLAGLTSFGKRIFLAASGKNVWISDRDNNRVIRTTLDNGQFGAAVVFMGTPTLATPLRGPERISAAGDRAVVLDWKNERLVKLSSAP